MATELVIAADLAGKTPPFLIRDGADVLRVVRCEGSVHLGRVFVQTDEGEEFNISPAARFTLLTED